MAKVLTSNFWLYTFAILFGILTGFSDILALHKISAFVTGIFINMFKTVSLPIIFLAVLTTISGYINNESNNFLWKRAVKYTVLTTFVATVISCILYKIIKPQNISHIASTSLIPITQGGYMGYLSGLVPSNIVSPFLENKVLTVLLLSLAIGMAVRRIPEQETKQTVIRFFQGLREVLFIITGWIIRIIPIGIFGFVATAVMQFRSGSSIGNLSQYLTIIILANVIQGVIILPLWLSTNKINPLWAFKGLFPALSLAFFSKSSAGTLPVTINSAEQSLGVNPKISRFILPLCTTINMNGCAAFIFTTVIYIMQNHGIQIDATTMATWIVIAVIAAIGNAGVPMGCFFLSASLLTSMNVPIHIMGLILPFYSIIDMVETTLNVWSDGCVTTVIDKKHRG